MIGRRPNVPLYDHADNHGLWEASTALVNRVGGTNTTVHIYSTNDTAAIAKDPLCHR